MILSRFRRGSAFGTLLVSGLFALVACSGGPDSQARIDPPPPSTCVDQDGTEVPCPEAFGTTASQGLVEPQTVESSTVGKAVYLQRCVGCHGVNGIGIVGPDIRPDKSLERYPMAADMEALVRDGAGEMPEFGSKLTDAEIAAVVAYVRGGLG